jgi:bifunctional DNase/RNase
MFRMQGSEQHPSDSGGQLLPVELRRLMPARDSAGLIFSGGGKQFLIQIGPAEAAAVMRELRSEKPERPLTHELVAYVLTAFEIKLESVVISSVVNDAFCATLTLSRRQGTTHERVRIDARASDAIVLALKHGVALQMTRRVLDQVDDISKMISAVDQQLDATAQDGADGAEDAESDGESADSGPGPLL